MSDYVHKFFAEVQKGYSACGLPIPKFYPPNASDLCALHELLGKFAGTTPLLDLYENFDGSNGLVVGYMDDYLPLILLPIKKVLELFKQNWPVGTIEIPTDDCRITENAQDSRNRVNWVMVFNGVGMAYHLVYDLDPGPKGTFGQILSFDFPCEVKWEFLNLEDCLTGILSGFERRLKRSNSKGILPIGREPKTNEQPR